MAITAAGVGSGLDIEGIVSQLMNLERRPLIALEQRESQFRAELSAFGRLKSSISDFQDAMQGLASLDKFRVYSTSSSDEDVLTASADSNAAAGTYALQIDRLAQNHKQATSEFADTDTFGGAPGDSLTLSVGADSLIVDLSTAKTLSELRDAINDAAENPGVSATIINTGSGVQRLVLTADESGYDSRVQLSYGGTLGAGTFNFGTLNTDADGLTLSDLSQLDASFSIDGIALTAASNSVSGVVDGITFEFKQTGSANLTLNRDTDKITEAATTFVDAYNKLQSTMNTLSSGDLQGDSVIRSVQRQLRAVVNDPPTGLSGSFSTLSAVGITTDPKTGELQLDETEFKAALGDDFAGVSELFANDDQGYAFRFEAVAGSLLDIDGFIESREDGLNDRIKRVEADQLDMEYRLELREKALRAQYAALDSLVGRLNSTSQFLFQQLG
jgi:flagellar hook-associated protein 2